MKKYIIKTTHSIARFIQVQLFLSLVSLPILVSWGLPISTMTAVGNFVFGPFLAAFLLCASLIFFTELLYIPNSWLIWILDKITNIWTTCLSWGSKSWLIGFYKPSLIILLCITLLAFIIMQHKKLGKLYPSIACLSLLLLATSSYLSYTRPHLNFFHIACGKKQITVTVEHSKVCLKDYGAFSKKLSSDSWVQYTLLPDLTKKTGRTNIDFITVENPNTLTFETLIALCQHGDIKCIELPYWDKELTKAGWRAFFNLTKIIEKEKVILKRIPLQN